jgi:tryptophan synthase alpha chain
MNRLEQLFVEKKYRLLAVYFTAGYPDPDSTRQEVLKLAEAGADIVEIGMPFSDPLADGPTIQHSSKMALDNGMSLGKLFSQLTDIRAETQMPVLLMGYLNPVLQYGIQRFCQQCAEVGIDGLILPDMPLEYYKEQFRKYMEEYNLCPVFLVTPQTSRQRILQIDKESRGFLYAVSIASTTGGSMGFGKEQIAYFKRLSAMKLKNPVLVGFGISDAGSFDAVCAHLNGGVVGSAFIRSQEARISTRDFVLSIRP